MFADQIFVLQKGKVAEQGTHTELLEAQGLYYGYATCCELHELHKDFLLFSVIVCNRCYHRKFEKSSDGGGGVVIILNRTGVRL